MAVLMLIGVAATWAALEPQMQGKAPATLAEAVREPLTEFFSRGGAVALLVLIVLYKLGDAFAGVLTTAFLLRGVGFSLTDVGWANKWLGVGATILGLLAGGALMAKLRLYKSLLLFGILQALTNLGFMALALAGKSYPLMIAVVAAENLCGGMGTAAFVALLMALCDRRFSATQYALLSALAALGRVYVGPAAGEHRRRPRLDDVLPVYVLRRPAGHRAACRAARAPRCTRRDPLKGVRLRPPFLPAPEDFHHA